VRGLPVQFGGMQLGDGQARVEREVHDELL
jgi:hypothetical protein